MNERIKHIIIPIELSIIIMGIFIYMLFGKSVDYSDSERRVLASKPELTYENVLSSKYMNSFEEYAMDHFPVRDGLRSVKAVCAGKIFIKMDNNGLYYKQGHIAKVDYPINYNMLDHAINCFTNVYDKYLKDRGITPYMVVIPDKSHYMDKDVLKADYASLYAYMKAGMRYSKFIDIDDVLSLDDYYRTDTHLRQENLKPATDRILDELKADKISEYEIYDLDYPFRGVYYSQAALNVSPDTIKYINNAELENCIVNNYDSGKAKKTSIYNMEKAYSKDPYEMFLDGPSAIITIENPSVKNGRQLIIFRDSFGSSIAPYFVAGYEKIVLVDIRYIRPSYLEAFVSFDNSDVIFIYSALLLNNSMGLYEN